MAAVDSGIRVSAKRPAETEVQSQDGGAETTKWQRTCHEEEEEEVDLSSQSILSDNEDEEEDRCSSSSSSSSSDNEAVSDAEDEKVAKRTPEQRREDRQDANIRKLPVVSGVKCTPMTADCFPSNSERLEILAALKKMDKLAAAGKPLSMLACGSTEFCGRNVAAGELVKHLGADFTLGIDHQTIIADVFPVRTKGMKKDEWRGVVKKFFQSHVSQLRMLQCGAIGVEIGASMNIAFPRKMPRQNTEAMRCMGGTTVKLGGGRVVAVVRKCPAAESFASCCTPAYVSTRSFM